MTFNWPPQVAALYQMILALQAAIPGGIGNLITRVETLEAQVVDLQTDIADIEQALLDLNFTIQPYYYAFSASGGAGVQTSRISSLVPVGPLSGISTLYIHKVDGEDTDRSLALSTLGAVPGSNVYLYARDDADLLVRFEVTGPATKTGDVWAVPAVAYDDDAGLNWPFANFQQIVASMKIVF